MDTATIDMNEANNSIRQAVLDRLSNTPKDDPKMKGYDPWSSVASHEPPPVPAAPPVRLARGFLDLLDEIKALHTSKSADYGSEADPLANIRQGAEFVDIEPWRACMVRIADKVQRLRTYCRTGRLVHEGVRDTLLDLASYSLLAITLYEETQDDG